MHENLVRMKAVSLILKDLEQQFVFVGGATVSLYATDPELADEVRPTDDVDVIVELATYGGYADLDEKLRSLGFSNDVASGVICRYKIKGIVVDVMPTETNVMGFSNKWYPEGFQNAIDYNLEEGQVIRSRVGMIGVDRLSTRSPGLPNRISITFRRQPPPKQLCYFRPIALC